MLSALKCTKSYNHEMMRDEKSFDFNIFVNCVY